MPPCLVLFYYLCCLDFECILLLPFLSVYYWLLRITECYKELRRAEAKAIGCYERLQSVHARATEGYQTEARGYRGLCKGGLVDEVTTVIWAMERYISMAFFPDADDAIRCISRESNRYIMVLLSREQI